MKTGLKPATVKAWAMLKKLEALAERGVDGEKLVAQRKIDRLKARLDFNAPRPADTPDLFRGTFKRASKAKWICSFPQDELDVANAVKWAIESAAGIQCLHRGHELLAEAAPSTANRLGGIADHIARSFRELIAKFGGVNGVSVADRGAFVMGLYDGMMNEPRKTGQRLPSRPGWKRGVRGKELASSPATNLHVHPYTLAFGLGRQIRFSVPLPQIAAELERLTRRGLANETAARDLQDSGRSARKTRAHSALPS